jgi:adenosylcobyric acid synthase
MTAKAVMVLGTTSGAGKSWLATALCRWYARQGLKVAPFKAQNMSNNARVVPGPNGQLGEIGSAQYFQALAARAIPDVRMNPVLVKPQAAATSQVVVLGQVHEEITHLPWPERSELLWPRAREALYSLSAENEVLVIEGAGSPAEINLVSSDYANMRTALAAHAACLLIADIDRGGAFAHLYGTHQLLPADERALFRGFVLNRFRGCTELLSPGVARLEALTGVPMLAVLPMWRGHGLPEEDGDFDDAPTGSEHGLRIGVIAYPFISNLDEFQPLRNVEGVRLIWVRSRSELKDIDWIILPGSKDTCADLNWLRESTLDVAIANHAAGGRRVLGICGGLQILGETLVDEVTGCNMPGLGLLPLVTTFERNKVLRATDSTFETTTGAWLALAGLSLGGYEIHTGRTTQRGSRAPTVVEPVLRNSADEGIGWQNGSVLGVYIHGLFESSTVLRTLFGAGTPTMDSVFDGLADFINDHFQPGALARLIDE